VCSPGTLPNASPITLPISALIIDDRNSNEGQIIYKEFVALSLQDIKPDNIMLDKWLTLKIGDFGFARAG
jgi:serine/threonine protein kinase